MLSERVNMAPAMRLKPSKIEVERLTLYVLTSRFPQHEWKVLRQLNQFILFLALTQLILLSLLNLPTHRTSTILV